MLSVQEARDRRVCRFCGLSIWGKLFYIELGREYAHQECLTKLIYKEQLAALGPRNEQHQAEPLGVGPDPKDAAQEALRASGIEAGQIYRHYKGGLYVVVATAIDEESLEPLVVYRSNKNGTTRVRTLKNFKEHVSVLVSRFTRVED